SVLLHQRTVNNTGLITWKNGNITVAGGATINNTDPGSLGPVTSGIFDVQSDGAINPAGTSLPSAGLVSWWQGEGNANDAAGNQPGTLVGNVGFVPGKVGQAFNFDGSSHVVVHDSPNLYPQDGSFTVQAWVATTQATGTQAIMSHWECGGNCISGVSASAIKLYLIDGKLQAYLRDALSNGFTHVNSFDSTTFIADGNFHHVAMERDLAANVFRVFVDGVLESSQTLIAAGPVHDE